MCSAGKTSIIFFVFAFLGPWIGCERSKPDYLVQIGERRFITRDEFDYAFQKACDRDPGTSKDEVFENLCEQVFKNLLLSQEGLDTTASFRRMAQRVERELVNSLVREEKFIRPGLSSRVVENFRSHLLQTVEVIFLVKQYDIDRPETRDSARAAIERLSRVANAQNFESMVRQHSDDRDRLSGLGSLLSRYVRYGESGYTVESAVFSLYDGMLTPPLEVPGAFLIAKAVGRRTVPTYSDYKAPTTAEIMNDLRERFLRDNVDKVQKLETDFIKSQVTPVLKDTSVLTDLVRRVLRADSSLTADHRMVAKVDSRVLTVRDFLLDHEKASFLNEMHVRNTFDMWIQRYILYLSQESRVKRTPAYSTAWLSFLASQYNSWIAERTASPDENTLHEFYRRNVFRYVEPATVTLNELYVTTAQARDSVQYRLVKGYKLIPIAQELISRRRMTDVNFVPNREISERDGSRVFREAIGMLPTEIRMVSLTSDGHSFIELVTKKDRRPLSYEEAASRVRSDWTLEQRRLNFLKAKARLAEQYPIVIHDVE
jgi:hypothetical protein